ncbi:MAG: adenylate/guanylate cyclase domain-containing protein [Myxococcales bacterium]|nr:adenylate/guanylate cyclase domain-containing protein [Myxococcales bacterium]MCB9752340.1 adenylate/guanylate cyclase domain-containing protein [Myxococcales bacterium]
MTTRLSQTSLLPLSFEASASPSELDERWFNAHCNRLTAEFAKLMGWIIAIVTLLFWPTDALMFPDDARMLDFFNFWRAWILGLSVFTVLGMHFLSLLTRHATVAISLIIVAGSGICGFAVARLGDFGEPFYACGYLLSMATIPIVCSIAPRVLVNVAITLAYAIPYVVAHPSFLGTPYAGATFLFHAFAAIASAAVGHSLYFLIRSNFRQQEKLADQAEELARAREKSERLLLNILPQPVARQLKDGAATVADAYDDITVMFIDICGFTALSDQSRPVEIVQMLNNVFSRFDGLVEHRALEKIKTIGDAYMVAGGLPETCEDHPNAIAALALDILDAAQTLRDPNGAPLRVRVGAHVGPVVAGVIGRKKFIYDLWGDTVNTASRMESTGQPGAAQISEALYRRLAPDFLCERRGAITIKGKGEMTTYFLRGRKSAGHVSRATPVAPPPELAALPAETGT